MLPKLKEIKISFAFISYTESKYLLCGLEDNVLPLFGHMSLKGYIKDLFSNPNSNLYSNITLWILYIQSKHSLENLKILFNYPSLRI